MEEIVSVSVKSDSEEDDLENFFLQPASNPYNIAEKIAEANKALYEEIQERKFNGKEQKVKFRETLVDFEPDLTDDDVQSIESYTEDVASAVDLLREQSKNVDDCYDIIKEELEEEDIQEEIILEQIAETTSRETKSEETITESLSSAEPEKETTEKKKRKAKCKKSHFVSVVDCRNHCIEGFDSPLSLSISKLKLNEKPPPCPTLKLHKRCDGKKEKLPLYTGCESEYGLSSAQRAQLEKRRKIIRQKEQKEEQLRREYERRKIQQNEIIFRQWLRDISLRKTGKQQAGGKKESSRPKTANCLNGSQLPSKTSAGRRKKPLRPYSTPCSVFIEVPEEVLRQGLNLGQVFVHKGERIHPEVLKLHHQKRPIHVLTFQ